MAAIIPCLGCSYPVILDTPSKVQTPSEGTRMPSFQERKGTCRYCGTEIDVTIVVTKPSTLSKERLEALRNQPT